jgi:hypothetical protein
MLLLLKGFEEFECLIQGNILCSRFSSGSLADGLEGLEMLKKLEGLKERKKETERTLTPSLPREWRYRVL